MSDVFIATFLAAYRLFENSLCKDNCFDPNEIDLKHLKHSAIIYMLSTLDYFSCLFQSYNYQQVIILWSHSLSKCIAHPQAAPVLIFQAGSPRC